jgi:hypothetical protein
MKKVKDPDPRDGWYEVDVESATALLKSQPKNRPVSRMALGYIVGDMEAGRWETTGEPIICDMERRMLDGQHRCRGVQVTGRPQIFYIVHVDASQVKLLDHLNRGKQRNHSDRLAMEGVTNYATVAAIVNRVLIYEGGGFIARQKRPDPREIRLRYNRDRQSIDGSATFAQAQRKHIKGMMQVSNLGFIHYITSSIDASAGHKFTESLATGEQISAGNPVFLLRQRLIENMGAKAKLPQKEVMALTIKAWVAFKKKKQLRNLRWLNKERFPKFED